MKANDLPFHEWSIIVLFCVTLLGLAGFALGGQKHVPAPSNSLEPSVKFLEITIEGQIAQPGVYEMPLHSTVKDLLEKSQPLLSADLSQIKNWRKLRDKQKIHIPERHWIEIEITGAVLQPGKMKILSGTRCNELEDRLQFLATADQARFRKRKKFLQEGDVLDIPSKKIKKKKAKKTRH